VQLRIPNEIRRSILIAAPVERVFQALTTPAEFGTWFAKDVEGDFEVGSQPIIDEGEYGRFRLAITAKEPPRYFAFRWVSSPELVPSGFTDDPLTYDNTLVEFFLSAEAGGTRVEVVESGFANLPERYAERNFLDNTDGWRYQMASLAEHVTGVPDAIERKTIIKAKPEEVWQAISDPARFGQWFGCQIEGEFKPGSQPVLDCGEHGRFRVLIISSDAPNYFAMLGPSGPATAQGGCEEDPTTVPHTLTEFWIKATEDGTKVKVRESGFSGLPAEHAKRQHDENVGGWDYQMPRIKNYVETGQP